MKKKFKNIPWLIITILIAIIVIQNECSWLPDQEPIYLTRVVHDTIPGDTVPYPVEVKTPVPYAVYYPDTVKITAIIDTMAILRDYFARRVYQDTITDDTSFMAVILDTISQNRIIDRQFLFQNLRPVAINTYVTPVEKERNKLFVGPAIGLTNRLDLGGSALLLTKKEHAYAYQYQLTSKQHQFTMYWKIKFKNGNH